MKTLLALLFAVLFTGSYAQTVTHGPIVGGVTDSSCRVYVRTSTSCTVTVEVSTGNFSTINGSNTGITDANYDNAAVVQVGGLVANHDYYARISINGTPASDVAHFHTFPTTDTPAHMVFITGSNINGLTDADSAIFNRAANEKAIGFIELGNWGYPDATGCFDIYYGSPPGSWAKNFTNVQNIYKQRYSSSNSLSFIKSQAMDYVYDDHDYMNEKAGNSQLLGYHLNIVDGVVGAPAPWSQPAQARTNSITGYQKFFPGYDLQNSSEGVYHSFRSGNAEFFVIDTRSMKGPEILHVDTVGSTNNFQYINQNNQYMLGTNQMNWLKQGLQNSTATWKFIVSSVPFNIGYRMALDTLIGMMYTTVPYWNPNLSCFPILPNYAVGSTNTFADMWGGWKNDGNELLNHVLTNNIPNVFVLSGHTGTVGMDDGTNSGLPELMCANMKQTNSNLNSQFGAFMGFNIWDMGGSGLCDQNNLSTTYGRIEIYGNDSLRMSALDASGNYIADGTFYPNTPYKYNPNYAPERRPTAVADAGTVRQGDTVTLTLLTNDINPNTDPLYTNLKTNPANGTAIVNSDNTITYIPNSGFSGVDTFSYYACNRLSATCSYCSAALATINVTQVTGTNDLLNGLSVLIYPNPAENVVFADAFTYTEALNITFTNTLGSQVLYRTFAGKSAIDISSFATGNYVYTVKNKTGETVKIGRISVVR